MDNRGEVVDREDRDWILENSGAYCADGTRDFLYMTGLVCHADTSNDGRAYGIREALIARKMGLSEGRSDAD